MKLLCGIPVDGLAGNEYFRLEKAKGHQPDLWGGLYRTSSSAQLFGPWRNEKKLKTATTT